MVDVFVIDGITKSEVEQQLRKYMDSLRIVNTYHPASEYTGADCIQETNATLRSHYSASVPQTSKKRTKRTRKRLVAVAPPAKPVP